MTEAISLPQPGEPMWINARVLTVDVGVDRGVAGALAPAPLRLPDPAMATLFVADYPETRFGSAYMEAAVILHCEDDAGFAGHCPWMVVDDATALILGREMLGFPKKMADIALEEDGDRVVGVVSRRGEVMRIEAELGETLADPEPLFGRRGVNLFGSIVGGMRLIDLAPAEETIKAARRAEAKVLLSSTERDPLGDLAPTVAGPGRYLTLDFGTGGGGLPELGAAVDFAWSLPRFLARAL